MAELARVLVDRCGEIFVCGIYARGGVRPFHAIDVQTGALRMMMDSESFRELFATGSSHNVSLME